VVLSSGIILFCPLLVIYFWSACTYYQCSIWDPIVDATHAGNLTTWAMHHLPKPTLAAFALYIGWLLFQGILYAVVPAEIGYGQRTPAGLLLPYVVNGWRCWWITHILFFALSSPFGLGLFPASIIADHWGGLLIAVNVYGYALSIFAFIKAHRFPSHADDRKFSGSWLFDYFMGIEANPRFGQWWDFKLFHNGRPGIIAWTLINASFAAAEYQVKGYVSKEMIALNIFHAIYVLDFFWNENWYLRTIDIAHDHFGFYLSWGDSVWLPFMYTLQSHYLLRNNVNLSWPFYLLMWTFCLVGYYIFRTVNDQKDLVRRTDGQCVIWGRPAEFIRAEYVTSDGKTHRSLLLTSGYWGLSRHFNYVGDLMMCVAFCGVCGVQHLLPWFYVIYMTILLVHRIYRDDDRCSGKYGKHWDEYKRRVPWKLMPYVY